MSKMRVLQHKPALQHFLNPALLSFVGAQGKPVGELASLLVNSTSLPKPYMIPLPERPLLPHDAFDPRRDLPLLDLSPLISRDARRIASLAAELAAAAREWGFFQVVNHGVPSELVERMMACSKSFFELSTRQKERVSLERSQGYDGNKYDTPTGLRRWVETLTVRMEPTSNLTEIAERSWPQGNGIFCATFQEYSSHVEKLGLRVVELLAEGLGLEPTIFKEAFESSCAAELRISHYPACPQPCMTLGQGTQCDPNGLTILYQDEVGGLQIRKGEDWIAVKPHPNAFVVNVGDLLEALSNCHLKSVQHRAVVNAKSSRWTVGYFYSPSEDLTIRTPQELIDDEHPVRYKPFSWAEYRAARRGAGSKCRRFDDMFALEDEGA